MGLKCCGDRPSGAAEALDQSRRLPSIVRDLWGFGRVRAWLLESLVAPLVSTGGSHFNPATRCPPGWPHHGLSQEEARILFWRSEMLLGLSPLRDSWFPWQCSHHCQSWKGLRESPGVVITGEFSWHLMAGRSFLEPSGPRVHTGSSGSAGLCLRTWSTDKTQCSQSQPC